MSGRDVHEGLFLPNTDDEYVQALRNDPNSTVAEYSWTAEDREALARGDQSFPRLSPARSSQSSFRRLEAAGFFAGRPLTALNREVLTTLSDEEADVLISLKERLDAAAGDTPDPTVGASSDAPWSTSQRLRGKLELVMPLLFAPNQALLRDPQLPQLYPEWALTFYHLARVFLPLMETALTRAQTLAADDPVAAGTAEYLARHIEEERHGVAGDGEAHLPDLEVLGVAPDEARRRPLPLAIAALAGYHCDWIVHRHPIALLGFVEVVEGYPPPLWAVEALIVRTGLPRAGFQFLLQHADLDLEHRDELHAVLDGLPVTPEQEAMIGLSAMRTVDLMSQALWGALDQPYAPGGGIGR